MSWYVITSNNGCDPLFYIVMRLWFVVMIPIKNVFMVFYLLDVFIIKFCEKCDGSEIYMMH